MRRRKYVIVVGCILMVILVAVARHFQLRLALARYITALKNKGEPMELAQVIPSPTPPEQNAAPLIFSSLTNLQRLYTHLTNTPIAMRTVSPGRALVAWQQPEIRSSNGTNSWEDLAHDLAAEKSELDTLKILSNHPVLNFHVDYGQGMTAPLIHIVPLRESVDVLITSAMCNLHQGDVMSAFKDIRTTLALVKGQTDEPLSISQRVRMVITFISASVTWEALHHPNVSANELELLQQNWQSLEFVGPLERSFLMERVLIIHSLDRFRANPAEQWQGVMGGDDKFLHKNEWRYFWSYADERRALQIYQVLVDATRMAETNRSYKSTKSFVSIDFAKMGIPKPSLEDDSVRIDIDESEMRWIYSDGARNSFSFLREALAAETVRDFAMTAIALKRYELQHQRLPEKLEVLAPDLLKTMPIDWMDGQPLRYRLNADGTFLLYSVGENGIDDGGNPSVEKHDGRRNSGIYPDWQNQNVLDWVWPQAAESGKNKASKK